MSLDSVPIERVLHTCTRQLASVTGRQVDGVVGVRQTETGWELEVELIHRLAVPDSMDLLGRYRVKADPAGQVISFEQLGIRRRGDPSLPDPEGME